MASLSLGRIKVTQLLVYLSCLSLPNGEDVGLAFLSVGYIIAIILIYTPLQTQRLYNSITKPNQPIKNESIYCAILIGLVLINFIIAKSNEIPLSTWSKRTIHIPLIVFYYIILTHTKTKPKEIFKWLYHVGIFETITIYAAIFIYKDINPERRATDIESVILYSALMPFASYFCVNEFKTTNKRIYLILFTLITVASIFTGSRILIISVMLPALLFFQKPKHLIYATAAIIISIPLSNIDQFQRFDLSDSSNMLTVLSKLEEFKELTKFFKENPAFGAGFGKAFEIQTANSTYTYSHNIILFYMGYSGLIGVAICIYPFIKLCLKRNGLILSATLLLYYTSNTSYTNTKHSILIAAILIFTESIKRQKTCLAHVTNKHH